MYLFTKYSFSIPFLGTICTEILTESKYTHVYWSVSHSRGHPYNSCLSSTISSSGDHTSYHRNKTRLIGSCPSLANSSSNNSVYDQQTLVLDYIKLSTRVSYLSIPYIAIFLDRYRYIAKTFITIKASCCPNNIG